MTTPTDKKTSTKKAKPPTTKAKTEEVTDPTKAPITTDAADRSDDYMLGRAEGGAGGAYAPGSRRDGELGDYRAGWTAGLQEWWRINPDPPPDLEAPPEQPPPDEDIGMALALALAALGRAGHTGDCARAMAWDGVVCWCGAEDPAPESEAFPRRRLMVSVKIAADDPGGVARSLLELINWIDQLERRAGGAGKHLKQRDHASGDRTRSYSVELDDQVEISHADYEKARAEWEAARE